MEPFAYQVDVDGGRAVDAFLVQLASQGYVLGARVDGHGAVGFLEVQGYGASGTGVTVHPDLADVGAHREVFRDEEAFG